MRRWLMTATLSVAAAGMGIVPQSSWGQLGTLSPAGAMAVPANGSDVPVKAVVLFSSGVGYFEHYGAVDGNGSTELRFKTQQINDILKSLVLEDLNGGKVTAITYPSQDPISKTLKSFQVDITDNPSMGDLLNQLRGAKVKLSMAGGEAEEGTILGLEKKPKAVGEKNSIEVWYLNLVAGGALRSLELDSVKKIDLEDAKLQEELNKALLALTQARDQDKKPVTINFTGQGQRHIRIGYVVETPIWKTSYRLLLGDDANATTQPAGAAKAGGSSLQGWAIVENQTDNDWNNVELSLVSGRPISFIQDLYQPLYIPRPLVQPELYASLRPQTYEGGMDAEKKVMALGSMTTPPPAAAPEAQLHDGRGGGARNAVKSVRVASDEPMSADAMYMGKEQLGKPMDPAASVASVASASKMGELFQYTVGAVSLPRQRSAMIPIITDPIEVQKLSIYNQSVLPRNPLNGARVKNTTAKHLLAGPLTVLDNGAYAGDARIDNVPPGQERLISYGIDLQVLVDATKNRQDNTIQSGTIVKGVLHLTRRHVFTQEYVTDNKGEKDKTVVIEHPLRQGWKLVENKDNKDFTAKPYETTEALYRFRGVVPAGKAAKLVVSEELVAQETFAILPADAGQMEFYAKTGELSPAVREALVKAIQLKSAMVDTDRQMNEKQQLIAQITQEQNRIRENMKTVDKGSQYYTRLMAKLNDQETQLEKLNDEIDGLRKQRDEQRKALEDYLSVLNAQ